MTKEQLKPFWFKSNPLLAAVSNHGQPLVFSLDEQFQKLTWMIVFIDLSNVLTDSILLFLREWYSRYKQHDFGVLLICSTQYGFQRARGSVEKMLDAKKIEFPLAIDFDDGLFRSFNIVKTPSIAVFNNGKVLSIATDFKELPRIENDLQKHLRLKDPGLPLQPPFENKIATKNNFYKVDLARGRGINYLHEFSHPHLGDEPKVFATLMQSPPQTVHVSGKFRQNFESLYSVDPSSSLRLYSHGGDLYLLAQSLGKIHESTKILVSSGGRQIPDMFIGEHLRSDDSGNAFIEVGAPFLYHILKGAPPEFRGLSFRFPNAGRVPVALFNFQSFDT